MNGSVRANRIRNTQLGASLYDGTLSTHLVTDSTLRPAAAAERVRKGKRAPGKGGGMEAGMLAGGRERGTEAGMGGRKRGTEAGLGGRHRRCGLRLGMHRKGRGRQPADGHVRKAASGR